MTVTTNPNWYPYYPYQQHYPTVYPLTWTRAFASSDTVTIDDLLDRITNLSVKDYLQLRRRLDAIFDADNGEDDE